jgi:hypothetical protein
MKPIIITLLLITCMILSCNDDTSIITERPPCLSSGSCKYALGLPTDTDDLIVEYYSSFDVQSTEVTWENLTSAVIIIHGNNRNANEYFDWLTTTLASIDKSENTVLIAPHLKTATDINGDSELIYWSSAGWKVGDNSQNTTTTKYSSYAIIDEFISLLSDKTKFPILEKIIVTGHSSGGQFTQAYAAANSNNDDISGINVHYIPANTQYYFYPREERYNNSTNQFEIPQNCGTYHNWPYGTNNLNGYFGSTTPEMINTRYITRNINYLLGSSDINTGGTFNETDCQATLLGATRFNRGENMFSLMETYFENTHTHQKVIVNGVGHSPANMYQSTQAKQLFSDILD